MQKIKFDVSARKWIVLFMKDERKFMLFIVFRKNIEMVRK